MSYTVEDLFHSINDIYYQVDEGTLPNDVAIDILKDCCNHFIKENGGLND
jgi:hypothetical protein